ncbi:MAG: 23S rRNA (guanosine(2251)-2'-O)-methyltransferase RlmB [Ruminococcaceae bacterium]|nr:23S rRNA (guanosine(2251)-2'-O)-methyltransferase RlmB [Oscillospiraceae bacterium]
MEQNRGQQGYKHTESIGKQLNERRTIEGRNPVIEALVAGVPLDKIWISETVRPGGIQKLTSLAREKQVPIQFVNPKKIDSISQTTSNQGVVAICGAVAYSSLEDILHRAEIGGHQPFIVIADEITDPHNLGAIIRSANAAGADGVIIPKNRSAGLDAVVAKTSAGAVYHTPVARVTNLVQTAIDLKKKGLWLVGADMSGEKTLFESDMTGSVALVVGSEGKGISRLLKEICDFMVKIPMLGETESLNASVAAAIMMYEVVRQRAEQRK